ncbi:MAG: glycosyltransferase family 2 protein [Lachnospiraceae bacterium]|nr:glycosyltransferase family 2 protein [Lachnospiraceae bacterium]
MEKDKITVIVPVYNVEKYLGDCLESVTGQTYRNLEIILVDDGSTDRSGQICDEYAQIDHRICVIHKSNGGLSDARNAGLEVSSGKYITFVDSDDYISPICIEALHEGVMKHPNADMVIERDCSRFLEDKIAELYTGSVKNIGIFSYKPEKMLELILYQKMEDVGIFGKLYKAELFNQTNIRFPYGLYYEDLATLYKLLLKSKKVIMLNCAIYAYRMRKDSIMHESFSDKKMSCIIVSRKLYKEVKRKIPELLPAAASRCTSVCRGVYTQIPYKMCNQRNRLWKEILKYRKIVLFDEKARKRERLSLLVSFLGQPAYYVFNRCFIIYKHFIQKKC